MIFQYLIDQFSSYWGPLRLLSSFTFLSAIAGFSAVLLNLFLLPRVWHLATNDKGRAYAHNAEASVGKPLGVGLFLTLFCATIALIIISVDWKLYFCVLLLVIASIIGFFDDAKSGGFSELTLGFSDLLLSFSASAAILYNKNIVIWLPFIPGTIEISFLVAILLYTPVLWLSINALNCNDGVDGLSGALSAMTLSSLALLLYVIIGHSENADYLLIPFNADASNWVILTSIFVGGILGYLWHNAPPSVALMGDAGSRPIGLLIGMLIVVAGNPLLILFICFFILANGATGLVKIAVIRMFKVNLFKTLTFPLHDHVRRKYNWSNTQVLVRFCLLHAFTLAFLMIILFKVR